MRVGDLAKVQNTPKQWAEVVPDGSVGVISRVPGFWIGLCPYHVVYILSTDGYVRPIGYTELDIECL